MNLKRIKDASKKGMRLPNTNLFFYGTKLLNNNPCVVLSFGVGGKKWYIPVYQLTNPLPALLDTSELDSQEVLKTKEDANLLEKDIVDYIQHFCTDETNDALQIDESYYVVND